MKSKDHKQRIANRKKIIGKVTCPECGYTQPLEIPTQSCQAFYQYSGCHKLIQAKKTCCVFCDYGYRQCPVADKHQK